MPATSSSPLTRTWPFPSPSTCVDVNRTCGCSSTSKKSADRRCLSRTELPVSTLPASIVSSISGPAGPRKYTPSNRRKRPRTVCRPQKCSTSNSTRRPGRIDRPPFDRRLCPDECAAHHVSFPRWIAAEDPGRGCHAAAARRVLHCRTRRLAVFAGGSHCRRDLRAASAQSGAARIVDGSVPPGTVRGQGTSRTRTRRCVQRTPRRFPPPTPRRAHRAPRGAGRGTSRPGTPRPGSARRIRRTSVLIRACGYRAKERPEHGRDGSAGAEHRGRDDRCRERMPPGDRARPPDGRALRDERPDRVRCGASAERRGVGMPSESQVSERTRQRIDDEERRSWGGTRRGGAAAHGEPRPTGIPRRDPGSRGDARSAAGLRGGRRHAADGACLLGSHHCPRRRDVALPAAVPARILERGVGDWPGLGGPTCDGEAASSAAGPVRGDPGRGTGGRAGRQEAGARRVSWRCVRVESWRRIRWSRRCGEASFRQRLETLCSTT